MTVGAFPRRVTDVNLRIQLHFFKIVTKGVTIRAVGTAALDVVLAEMLVDAVDQQGRLFRGAIDAALFATAPGPPPDILAPHRTRVLPRVFFEEIHDPPRTQLDPFRIGDTNISIGDAFASLIHAEQFRPGLEQLPVKHLRYRVSGSEERRVGKECRS